MTTEEIINIIMQYMPTLIAIGGVIGTCLKMFNTLKDAINQVKNANDNSALIKCNEQLIEDNKVLTEKINKLIEAQTHVKEV